MHRKLPVYFLLDCSESMIGEGIQAVETGMKAFLDTLRKDPQCLESVWVSVIIFNSEAKQIIPLSELMDVNLPPLHVRPGTALGEAYELLVQRINVEVTKNSAEQKGDWRPLIFVITDGQPTDDFRKTINAITTLTQPRIANVYAIGCGEDVDLGQLNEISDIVLKLDTLEPEGVRKLFVWLTDSIQTASIEVDRSKSQGNGINLDKLPSELTAVDSNLPRRSDDTPRQVFVKASCSVKRQPYLMRYKLIPEKGYYEPVKSHILNPEYEGGGNSYKLPLISSKLLGGPTPCPHCGQEGAGSCSNCGTVFCLDKEPAASINCPGCGNTLHFDPNGGGNQSFDIKQSAG